MANYNSKKNRTGRIVACVLVGVLSVAAVAGAGTALYMGAKNNGWFEKEVVEEDNTVQDENAESTNSMILENTESNGIKLTTAKLTAEEYEEYGILTASVESAYTIKVSSYNSDASDPKFTWTSSDTSAVTVSASSDTMSCVVTCLGAFSTQVTITCTVQDNTSVSATCTCDYVKRITAATFSLHDGNEDNSFGGFGLSSAGTVGTFTTPSYSYSDYANSYFIYDESYTYGTGTKSESYTVTFSYKSAVTGSSYTLGSSESYLTFISNVSGVSTSSISNSSVYSALASYYNSGTAAVTFTVSVVGNTTGETYSFSCGVLINPKGFYTSVSSFSLDTTSLAF